MTLRPNSNHKSILIAFCLVFLISAVGFALNMRVGSQRFSDSSRKEKNDLLKQVENSPEQALKIIGNDDCPLKLVEATVKEIPDTLFTKLTGRTIDLPTVCSVPKVMLVNTSQKTITGFVLAVRGPEVRATRGLVQKKIMIAPGQTYIVKRNHFVNSEKLTVVDKNDQVGNMMTPDMNSEKYWIHFAQWSDLFATIGLVDFEDGSSWMLKEDEVVKLEKHYWSWRRHL